MFENHESGLLCLALLEASEQETTTYVFMVHVLEHSEFPVSSFGVDGGLEGPGQLLDGHSHGSPVREQVLTI